MKKEIPKKNIADIFNEAGAVIWLRTNQGGANVTLSKNGKHSVQFVNDEGWSCEDMELEAADILKVAKFIKALNGLSLEKYNV